MAIAFKPGWARVFEVVGEIPFTTLTIAACAMLFRFRTRKNKVLSLLSALGAGLLYVMFAFMGGFMTYNYLTENLSHVSPVWALIAGLAIAVVGIWLAKLVPGEASTTSMPPSPPATP